MVPAMLALIALSAAVIEWIHWFWNVPPMPGLTTVFAVLLVGISIFTFYWTRPALRNLKQGRLGEQVVAQELERLRVLGYEVFHDIMDESKGCNVDHVLVGPGGVFTVETKTWSKCGAGSVTVEAGEVRINGVAVEHDCLAQARAQASSVRDLIQALTGETFSVQPVLVFPGWFVVPPTQPSDVWVLNPKLFAISLKQAGRRLSPNQIRLVTHHLERCVREAAALRH